MTNWRLPKGPSRVRLFQFMITNPSCKTPLYVWEASFTEAERWVRGEFKRTKSKHVDVVRLTGHGKISNFAQRYYRDMTHKPF